jgi:multiple sugar transport system substrate-binding protein
MCVQGGTFAVKHHLRQALSAVAVAGLVATTALSGIQYSAHAAGPIIIKFWMGADTTPLDTTQTLVNNFNKMEAGKIQVVWETQSTDTGIYFKNLQRALQAKSTTPDVFGSDVIYPAQLASAGLIPAIDKYFSKDEQANYLPGTIQDVTYKGHIYGAPWFTDFGLLYYRKDLLAKYNLPVPTTWEQMQSEAKTLVSRGAVKEGFVFQGNQYEGLVCNALEYIWGAGGQIYGPKAASTMAQAAKGLDTMRSMITSGASPAAVSTYQEAGTNDDFVNGLAAFARNWPYMWGNAQAKTSKVAGKVGVTTVLHEPGQSTGYGTIGGWWLGINKNSAHQDAAWQFIHYLISPAAQIQFSVEEGHAVALKAANSNPSVIKANPWLKTVAAKLAVLPRPTSPVYSDISLKMQADFHNVLTGNMTSMAAVKDIESYITVVEARFQ